jgi:hypothetical protein
MCENILNIHLVNETDVPASLNTADSVRYPLMLLLLDRPRYSQGVYVDAENSD